MEWKFHLIVSQWECQLPNKERPSMEPHPQRSCVCPGKGQGDAGAYPITHQVRPSHSTQAEVVNCLWCFDEVQNYIVLDPSCSYVRNNICNLKLTCPQHSCPSVVFHTEQLGRGDTDPWPSHSFPDVYVTQLLSPTPHLCILIDFTPLARRGRHSARMERLLKDVGTTASWNVQLVSQFSTQWRKNSKAKSWSKIVVKSKSTC